MKPFLALDVDGPIAVLGSGTDVFELDYDSPCYVPLRMYTRLARLSEAFQIVWSTSWRRSDCERLAENLGLPSDLPYIDYYRYKPLKPGQSRKLRGLRLWLKDHPAAVVDDEIDADLRRWAAKRRGRTLLVQVDPRVGLADAQVEELLRFAAVSS